MWQRRSVTKDSQAGGQQVIQIQDVDPQIEYSGDWVQISFSVPTPTPHNETSHMTGKSGSTLSVSFNGTQINVTGSVPAGDGALSANYFIDNGAPLTAPVKAISGSPDLIHQTIFVSPILKHGPHNITVQVVETGSGRNYTFQNFHIATDENAQSADDDNESPSNPNGGSGHSNVAGIVGGILGSVIVLLLAVLFFIWRRKRRTRIPGTRELALPRMYYGRPLSSESMKVPFGFDQPSVLDTGSRFTFAAHKAPTNSSRRSWVTVDRPPTIPQSALLSERDIADWSTYKGSSVIYQPPPPAERSHFSPYTAKTLTSMAFTDATPRPLSQGATERSYRKGSQPSISSNPIARGSHKF